MKNIKLFQLILLFIFLCALLLCFNTALADRFPDRGKHIEKRSDCIEKRIDRREDRPYGYNKRPHKEIVRVPARRRTYRDVVVVRPYGHPYYGYGYYRSDEEAWKWLAFTAISLKVLDNISEQAQREHEAAQVKATTAPVGEKINWDSDDASGYVVATKKGTDSSGSHCREFQQSITVGGKTEEAFGQACLTEDGSWKVIS